jgi:hypothetical protein
MAIGFLWLVNILTAAVSVALLAALLFVYGRNYREIPSRFSLGLVLFATFFLVQNVVAIGVYLALNAQGQGPDVAMPMLALNAVEAVGFGILLAISWE